MHCLTRGSTHDALVMFQVIGTTRPAVSGEIARRRKYHTSRSREQPRLETRVREFADADSEIKATADQIDVGIGEIELDFDPRIRRQKRPQVRHDIERRKG